MALKQTATDKKKITNPRWTLRPQEQPSKVKVAWPAPCFTVTAPSHNEEPEAPTPQHPFLLVLKVTHAGHILLLFFNKNQISKEYSITSWLYDTVRGFWQAGYSSYAPDWRHRQCLHSTPWVLRFLSQRPSTACLHFREQASPLSLRASALWPVTILHDV